MKNGDLSIVFPVQGIDGSLMGQDLENRVGNRDTGNPSRPFFEGVASAQ